MSKGGNKDHKKTLCWNANHCQNSKFPPVAALIHSHSQLLSYFAVCPESCAGKPCSSTGVCCNESCIGGCSGPDGSECTVCRHLSIDPAGKRRCVDNCPVGMYKYHTRCVSYEECYNMKKPISLDADAELPDTPFIPHNGTCTMDCPLGYEQLKNETKVDSNVVTRRWCKQCITGNCPKKCDGSSIDNTQTAQLLKGCEIITGSLEIQLRSRGGGKTDTI